MNKTRITVSHMHHNQIALLENVEFWRSLLPGLHISNNALQQYCKMVSADEEAIRNAGKCFAEDGYFLLDSILPLNTTNMLAGGVTNLVNRGILPVFAYLYDEYWIAFKQLTDVLKQIAGDEFLVLPDFWAWYINKGEGSAGFAPHRDAFELLRGDDGKPILFTIWIPLVNVDTFNSCMHVVPKTRDKNFPDNLNAYETRDDEIIWDIRPQDIVALPAAAGSVLGWDANLIHWGGRSTNYAKTPRISYAFYIQRKCSNPIYNSGIDLNAELSFGLRLRLIATQLKIYSQRFAYTDIVKHFMKKHCIDELIS